MFNRRPPINVYRNGFPNKRAFAVFQAIEDLIKCEASLDDLHRTVIANPGLLEIKTSIQNITGPKQSFMGELSSERFNASFITPLQYAFLTGREDAFQLLLTMGANIDGKFIFQCTSMSSKVNKASKKTTSIYELMCGMGRDSLVDIMRPLSMRHAFLTALLQLGDSRAFDYMMHQIETCLKWKLDALDKDHFGWRDNPEALAWYQLIGLERGGMLDWIPAIDLLAEKMGMLPGSMKDYIDNIATRVNELQSAIENRSGDYVVFSKEACDFLAPLLKQLADFFESLSNNVSDETDADAYRQYILQQQLIIYSDFDKNNKKLGFLSGIRGNINRSCYWLYNREKEPSDKELAVTILLRTRELTEKPDAPALYFETLLEFARNQTKGFANKLHHAELMAATGEMTKLLSTPDKITAESICTVVNDAVNCVRFGKASGFASSGQGVFAGTAKSNTRQPQDQSSHTSSVRHF